MSDDDSTEHAVRRATGPTVRLGRPPASTPPPAPLPMTELPTERASVVAPAPRASQPISLTTPAHALLHDEAERTRHFSAFGLSLAVSATIAIPLLPGRLVPTILMIAGAVIAMAALGYLNHRARDPETFRGPAIDLAWYLSTLAATMAIPYYGPSSGVSVITVVGIYFTGLGESRRVAIAVWATSALVEAALAGLVISGAMADPGVLAFDHLTPLEGLVLQLQLQVVLLAALLLSRRSRRTTTNAIAALERAVRTIAAREALLDEARADLARALDASGPGRFSEQVLGAYRLGALLGRGGMGEVYEATHITSGAPAAVKVLTRNAIGEASLVRRFLRELHTAAAIESPHVVRVLEVGEAPIPYLAMERLRGSDLAELLRRRGTLTPAEVIDLTRQVGAGISAAAAAGVVHRDLKPQNVFLEGTTWKVLDFGVAKLAVHDDSTQGLVVGTPAYMAPEQARGGEVDRRTDLYALAALVYRAITGRAPFAGKDAAATLFEVVHHMPHRPSRLAPVPEDVDAVLAIGLAKQPDDRFATASQLTIALDAAFERALPEGLRQKARALLQQHPWTT
ncbi:MAG: serine/threonine protein kinase [Deltaproteobacteria bacterium]|nr:serine/threonine protein kinase [Deltaproteobacteria bacterium]